ncbi:MAG: VWA domain-containing protein [Planctomycetales bacterium]|nr:VWA domain-containing protein [Planctomycetales bacterium]
MSMVEIGDDDDLPRYEMVQKAVAEIFEVVRNDKVASNSVRMNVVTFGGNVKSTGFNGIDEVQTPDLSPNGGTPLGSAVDQALDETDARLIELNDEGRPYNVASIFLFTDGQPTEDEAFVRKVAQRVCSAVQSGNLFFHAFTVCDADKQRLTQLGFPNVSRMPSSYREFVQFVSMSIVASSRGQKGESFGA